MLRKLTVGLAVLTVSSLATTVSASTRVFVEPRFGYYYGPAYPWHDRWYGGPVYFPDTDYR